MNVLFEATGDFPFNFYIEKAIPIEKDGELIIEGIASTTNIDHDNERMSKEALHAMEATINKNGVPLRVEHQKEGDAVIGNVFKGWVDERNQLHIQARLDKSHAVSPLLFHAIKSGTKMGLSVGGLVKRAVKEMAESVGSMVKTFYDVMLNEVSVTPRPSNYDAWLTAKSFAKHFVNNGDEAGMRREFLLENPQYIPTLDYLQAFAKSVPDEAWHKVEVPNNINKNDKIMKDKEEETTKTKETSTEETEKAVSRAEFDSLAKAVVTIKDLMSKGFESVGALVSKAMDGGAKDATNPDKAKEKETEQQTAKMDGGAPKDQANPDKAKEQEPEQQTAKAKADEEETEKAKEDDEDETKKAAKKDDTYDMETVERSIRVLGSLQKKLSGVKKAAADEEDETKKAKDDEDETKKASGEDDEETKKAKEDEDETKKAKDDDEETTKAHPLDVFIAKMTQVVGAIVEKMEKSSTSFVGGEKVIVEKMLRDNPEITKDLMTLLKVPGFKKSVSMGVPYFPTRDGRRVPLISLPTEKVEKSDDKPKDFKSVYKSDFSSVAQIRNAE